MTDSDTNTQQQSQQPSSGRMIFVMGLIGLLASALLVVTYQLTLPYIQANRAEFLEQAIFDVLPDASRKTAFVVQDEQLVPMESEEQTGVRVYAGYDAQGALAGVAVEAQGQGFVDVLRLIYGYDPSCQCVVGMKVLESKETPGLGDKIEKDESFQANFRDLDVALEIQGNALAHDVEMVKQGAKTEKWQVEAITGATVSSRAVSNIIGSSASRVVPLIQQNLDVLTQSAPVADATSSSHP